MAFRLMIRTLRWLKKKPVLLLTAGSVMSFLQWISTEEDWVSKEIEFGLHGFVEYHPGNTNLIISIPHGGEMKPNFLKDRSKVLYEIKKEIIDDDMEGSDTSTNLKVTVGGDKYTMQIGKELVKQFLAITGRQPYVVLTNLHRVKLDCNRPIHIGACPDEHYSQHAHQEYHSFIRKASEDIGGPGLLIDLHGQNHKQNSIELGYLLLKSELNASKLSKRSTSVQCLLKRSGLSIEEILYGENSLGALLEDAGYWAVPSPRQTMPGEQKYYPGGYITQTHGSSKSGEIDSIQMEVPGEIRAEPETRLKFARDLAKVLHTFHSRFYS